MDWTSRLILFFVVNLQMIKIGKRIIRPPVRVVLVVWDRDKMTIILSF